MTPSFFTVHRIPALAQKRLTASTRTASVQNAVTTAAVSCPFRTRTWSRSPRSLKLKAPGQPFASSTDPQIQLISNLIISLTLKVPLSSPHDKNNSARIQVCQGHI